MYSSSCALEDFPACDKQANDKETDQRRPCRRSLLLFRKPSTNPTRTPASCCKSFLEDQLFLQWAHRFRRNGQVGKCAHSLAVPLNSIPRKLSYNHRKQKWQRVLYMMQSLNQVETFSIETAVDQRLPLYSSNELLYCTILTRLEASLYWLLQRPPIFGETFRMAAILWWLFLILPIFCFVNAIQCNLATMEG